MRVGLPTHPFAEAIPAMTPQEFAALRSSIQKSGLQVPIVVFDGKVLDGRHRLRACEELRVEPKIVLFAGTDEEAKDHVAVLNLHRRHLNAEQKRRAVAALLRRDPARSDRAIAAEAGVAASFISSVRDRLSSSGVVGLHPERRVGRNGVAQRVGNRPGRPEYKAFAERAAEIAPLAAKGMSVHQIASTIGVSLGATEKLIQKAGIKVPARSIVGKSRRLDPALLVSESVTTIAAVARGLERVEGSSLDLSKEDASAMLSEVLGAARQIKWLTNELRRIANG
jgi:ParB-like chromosome segregation protein Spo0J